MLNYNVINLDKYPTVNQVNAHSKTSQKYKFINTRQLANVLIDQNWLPVSVQEARAGESNKGFQKHIIRFRHQNHKIGNDYIEAVISTSHLGNATFIFNIGVFRTVCLNGLIAGNTIFDNRIRHMGFTEEKVFNALTQLMHAIPTLTDNVTTLQNIEVTDSMKVEYTSRILDTVYDEKQKTHILAPSLLHARRYDDQKPTLWNNFNIAQENIVKGLVRTDKHRYTRRLTGVDSIKDINTSLWDLTNNFAKELQ